VLADQAAVTSDDLKRLAGSWRRRPQCIVAALYAGTTGVPAIFPRSSFTDLAALRGDRGAQSLLRRSADHLVRVPKPAAELDLDTPEDLLALEPPKSGAP
jgi:molybdenum cofactor cytidylyltransferase